MIGFSFWVEYSEKNGVPPSIPLLKHAVLKAYKKKMKHKKVERFTKFYDKLYMPRTDLSEKKLDAIIKILAPVIQEELKVDLGVEISHRVVMAYVVCLIKKGSKKNGRWSDLHEALREEGLQLGRQVKYYTHTKIRERGQILLRRIWSGEDTCDD
jgi:hypothetical protein